jgi:hypothetical protein
MRPDCGVRPLAAWLQLKLTLRIALALLRYVY